MRLCNSTSTTTVPCGKAVECHWEHTLVYILLLLFFAKCVPFLMINSRVPELRGHLFVIEGFHYITCIDCAKLSIRRSVKEKLMPYQKRNETDHPWKENSHDLWKHNSGLLRLLGYALRQPFRLATMHIIILGECKNTISRKLDLCVHAIMRNCSDNQ